MNDLLQIETWINLVKEAPAWVSACILAFASFIEYVFPPFPGDTILVAGGFFAGQGAISLPITAVALFFGALAGSSLAYFVGRAASKSPKIEQFLFRFFSKKSLSSFESAFQKYGNWILVTNRFFPGIRAFFMFGAGFSSVSFGKVLLFGSISTVLWNGMLIAVGMFVARNLENLVAIFNTYTAVAGVFIGLVLLGIIGYALKKKLVHKAK